MPVTPAPAAGVPVTPAPAAAAVAVPATPPPAAARLPPSATVAFEVPASSGAGSGSTVQFLAAVQPGQGTPLAEQAASGGQLAQQVPAGPAAAATPAAAGAPVQAQAAAVVEPGQPVPGAAAVGAQVASEAAGIVPTGGVLSVSSPLLTSGQEIFVAHLAQATGLDPHVVAAWTLAEESGPYAVARQGASNYNWLNIGYFDSGTGQIAFDSAFKDPVSAAEQTANFLKGSWGGASSSIRAILSTVGESPDQQIAAIADSDWASSHYDGGANLHGTYQELGDLVVDRAAAT